MYMVILSLHIAVALALIASTLVVIVAATQRHATRAYRAMLGTLGLTAASGIGLLLIVPSSLGHLCAMMTIFTVSVIGVRQFYNHRLQTSRTT